MLREEGAGNRKKKRVKREIVWGSAAGETGIVTGPEIADKRKRKAKKL